MQVRLPMQAGSSPVTKVLDELDHVKEKCLTGLAHQIFSYVRHLD